MEYVQALRDFCGHLITHVVVIAALFGINLLSSSLRYLGRRAHAGLGNRVGGTAFTLFWLPRLCGPPRARNQIETRFDRKR
ncbi:2TM domain-containing protein [Aeromonas simiae]|uniref:2TM domain-containing protein n=1 Tax=Aeromonas simiae TaxID=218936 RepID=A0A5J6WRB5_9GAMM|nr:hypothetical protein [Aeromonas simiae]QFI53656.1 2TM domain-containing protein [Aeromonas simiae]